MSQRLRRTQTSAARRASIERCGSVPASVPVWSSREAWVDAVRAWAASAAFRAVCAALGTRGVISAAAVVAVAVALAEFADHATGRNVAVTNRVLAGRAGCSERTVTTARTVLAAAGFGMEARRGHGSATTHTAGNRPSIWHLIGRRQRPPELPPTNPQQDSAGGDTCDLPPSGGVSSSSPVGNHSPSARERAPATNPRKASTAARQRWRATPRPLALQRLAGQLATRCHGLGRGHVGNLCDALTAAGIDPEQWTTRQLTDALDADMRVSGWSWPDHIERPGGFLAARLRRMLARRSSGGTAAGQDDDDTSTARPTPTPPRYTPEPPPVLTDAQHARIDQVRAALREHFTARTRSRTAPQPPVTPPSRAAAAMATPTTPCVSTSCMVCGAADAPRRPFLPARRAHVCDSCWTSAERSPNRNTETQKLTCKDVCESLHVGDRMPL